MLFKQFSIFFLILSVCTHSLEARSRGKKSTPAKNVAVRAPLSMNLPKDWECISDPSQLPEKVKKIYIGAGKGNFTPSINIACEETQKHINDYIQAARNHHEGQNGTKCQQLGTLDTKSGPAHLLQIDRTTEWGKVRFLQAAIIQDGMAYVITATALQEEFGNYYTLFFQAIQSFSIS